MGLSQARIQFEIRRLEFLERQLELHEKAQHRKAITRVVLGLFLGFIVGSALLFLFLRSIPDGNRDVVIALVSGLTGAFFGTVINYYFGDSESRVEQPPHLEGPRIAPTPEENEEELSLTPLKDNSVVFDPNYQP